MGAPGEQADSPSHMTQVTGLTSSVAPPCPLTACPCSESLNPTGSQGLTERNRLQRRYPFPHLYP